MAEQLVLHFETKPGRYPDTEVAAAALLDWVRLVRAAVASVDPNQELRFQTLGVRPGSTRFPQIVQFLETHAGLARSSWDDYPHLKSIVAGSAHTLFTASVAAGVSLAVQPSETTVKLSDTDRELLLRVADDREVTQASQRFYRTLEQDTAIAGVGVADSWGERPKIIIPRSEFAERGGVWAADREDVKERTQRDVWDVVLLKPALVSTPQNWQFMRDGLRFSAKMYDGMFLAAIRDGKVPLTLQEGVVMRVEVEYAERLSGQLWETVPNSRRIVRVLSPSPRT